MAKFRKKPITIEAQQYVQIGVGVPGMKFRNETDNSPYVDTLEGPLNVSLGDWIIRGVKGEYYPCKPDVFEASYEVAE